MSVGGSVEQEYKQAIYTLIDHHALFFLSRFRHSLKQMTIDELVQNILLQCFANVSAKES